MNSNSLLYIENLEKDVDDFHLGPVNLSIEPGTITAVVGNNGSGKSTLLKLIMNLLQPQMGNIKVNNMLVHGDNENWKQFVAYQPQTTIGWDSFTGTMLKDLIAPLYPNWDERLYQKMIELFHVPVDKRFGKLSQGVQQKLNLALTIPRNAPLLILDEPTNFMDIPSKKLLIDLLVDWMEPGNRSIIIASHQIDDIRKLSDYLFVLHNGEVIGNFEKEELMEHYARYWLAGAVPETPIPGAISREGNVLISDNPSETEHFLEMNNVKWNNRSSLEMEDIITLLLTKKNYRRNNMEVMLTVEGLRKSFKDKQALKGISFEVRKGEIMAILGPNGAGKSTTIRNIMGIMYPDEGSITFHNHQGKEIPRNKIGYLPEERGLYKNVKVMDILLYLADLKDYPLDKAKERILMYLKKFDLEGKEKVSMEELSKGMGQRYNLSVLFSMNRNS